MQVAVLPHRSTRAGTELALLVLAADSGSRPAGWTRGSIAIDVASGALVRFLLDGDCPDLPAPYSLMLGTLADSQQAAVDPAQPEAVALSGDLRPAGRLPARRIGRYLRPLAHPRGRHLLGCAEPALPYWTFDGHRPSAALVDLDDSPVVLSGPGLDGPEQPRCRFGWNGSTMDLPITDRRIAAALRRTGRPWLRGPSLAGAVGGSPRHLVVAWSPPVEGHCYKVVAGILPRP